MRSRLGIETENALKLLHKTQSAKNLGSLTDFLRDFMLDEPKTCLLYTSANAVFATADTVWHRSGSCALQIAPSQCELGLQGALGDAHRVAVVRHHRADDGLLRQEAGIRHAAGRLAQQQRCLLYTSRCV